MSFASYISRIFGKRPVWLYRITVGAQTFHITPRASGWETSPDKPSTDYPAGQVFASAPVLRGELFTTTLANRSDTWLRMPTSSAVIQAILDHDDPTNIEVTIWHTFAGDPDEEYVIKFMGRVVNVEPTLILTTLICDTDLSEMARSSVAQVMQRPCRHAHYFTNSDGGGCRLNLADFQQAATVTDTSGANVTVPLAAAQPDGAFVAGIFEYQGVEYMIESHAGSALRLESVPPGLAADVVGGPVSVLIAEGCNLTMARCNEFGNVLNFGGFPWMKDTPFDGGSLV